ncbi:MAG: hypothetical protein K0R50_2386 [Eubacterium sp.]|jgi:uncharacterized protein YaiE (UPF0345 family)|nr:hypothetical protein [Eubacterium sp.]
MWELSDLTKKPVKVKGIKGAVKIAVSGKYHYVTFEDVTRLVVLDKKNNIKVLNAEEYLAEY